MSKLICGGKAEHLPVFVSRAGPMICDGKAEHLPVFVCRAGVEMLLGIKKQRPEEKKWSQMDVEDVSFVAVS